jgi:hypothetical protein
MIYIENEIIIFIIIIIIIHADFDKHRVMYLYDLYRK